MGHSFLETELVLCSLFSSFLLKIAIFHIAYSDPCFPQYLLDPPFLTTSQIHALSLSISLETKQAKREVGKMNRKKKRPKDKLQETHTDSHTYLPTQKFNKNRKIRKKI